VAALAWYGESSRAVSVGPRGGGARGAELLDLVVYYLSAE